MANKSNRSGTAPNDPNARVVCRNRRAHHDYELLDELDCGIVLQGSEVKSIRNSKISIDEAYAKVQDGEVWLLNCDIAVYPQANVMNHEPRRPRKLLMKKREMRKFAESGSQQGLTMVPLAVSFQRGLVKVRLAIARGRRKYDKREQLKKADAQRSIREAMKHRQ
jgi:SsrA-binding protein